MTVLTEQPAHRREEPIVVGQCGAKTVMDEGDVLSVARVAGIQAAKRTSDMIPLCHPLLVGAVSVNFEIGDDFVAVEVHVDTVDRTGVEMEALHACAMAALTIYDMCKSADRSMTIGDIALWEKTGGRSGTYRRDPGDTLDETIDSVLIDHAVDPVDEALEGVEGATGMIGPAGLGDPAEV